MKFSVPDITREDIDAVVETLKSGWLTTGAKSLQLEEAFAAETEAEHAVSLSSGTSALFLSLIAEGVESGDEVITTPLTFASTANVIHHLGARPVFADIDPETFNIDPDAVEAAVTPRTRAVIPVHFAGQSCDMQRIMRVAEKHNLRIIEDAAHALGAAYKGKKIGGSGNLTCFSLFPTKNITAGEGGVITLNDPEKDKRLRRLRLHGMSKDGWKRYAKEGSWYYEIHEAGYKCNLSDINAALALTQLKRLNHLNRRRRELVDAYCEKIHDIPGIRTQKQLPGTQSSWHIFPVWVDRERYGMDRNQLVKELWNRNIGTSVHFIPVHLQPFYQKTYGYQDGDFPEAEKVFRGILSLPLFPRMLRKDADDVAAALLDISPR
ncbi:MAG: DegT/DnrJ/EryC1/StrS family aminotransferase [Candidatus Aminicenantes bacterium]